MSKGGGAQTDWEGADGEIGEEPGEGRVKKPREENVSGGGPKDLYCL